MKQETVNLYEIHYIYSIVENFSVGKIFMDLSKIRCEPYKLFDYHVETKCEICENFTTKIFHYTVWQLL